MSNFDKDNKIVEVYERSSYGKSHLYPKNEVAKHFAWIANQKTLTWHTLDRIKKLGYKIVVVPFVHPDVERFVSKHIDARRKELDL